MPHSLRLVHIVIGIVIGRVQEVYCDVKHTMVNVVGDHGDCVCERVCVCKRESGLTVFRTLYVHTYISA